MKRNKPITTLVHNQQTIKVKHKSKEEGCNHKITPRHVIEKETKELDEKPLRRPSRNKSFHQRIKLEYTNNKKPSKSSLLNVLEPSKLLLPTDFSESCLLQLSRSRNTPNYIRQASPASFGKSLKLLKFQNILYTLKMCGLCLDTNLLSRYVNERGKEKRLE